MDRASLILVLATALMPMAASAGAYEDAFARSRTDALEPTTRQWYRQEMRPAFRTFFSHGLNACSSTMTPETQKTFGLVFTVTSAGKVGDIHWRTPNDFTACLEPRLRSTTFPAAPKEPFHIGLGGS